MSQKIFLLFLFVFNLLNKINSQSNQNIEKQIIPVSPSAASLGKYGNVPVNYYSGVPQISIPIYTIKTRELNLPITLSYNNNGLKVEEIASWIGLGWGISVGGCITRTVKGSPDDLMNGYLTTQPMKVKFMNDNYSNPTYTDDIKFYLSQAGQGLYDTEPDIYQYNFLGKSGKFYYNQEEEEFYTLPKDNLKIIWNSNNSTFKIILADGTTIFFAEKEVTTTSGNYCSPGGPPNTPPVAVITCWYISKIVSADASEEMNFEYINETISYETINTSSKYLLLNQTGEAYLTPPDFNETICNQAVTWNAKRITNIYFTGGKATFIPNSTARCDLGNSFSLNSLEIYSNVTVIKKFGFEYDYFGKQIGIDPCLMNQDLLRLKLKSIKEYAYENNTWIQDAPYIFEYNNENDNYPSRKSFAQDNWGYYNGQNSNSSLIPSSYVMTGNGPMQLNGANRKANFEFTKFGVLNKVIYPTGGFTTFEFEQNDTKNPQMQPEAQLRGVLLEGDHNGGVQTYYEQEFVINYPPNFYNGYHVNGGAYVDFNFGEIGCTYTNGQTSSCAVLSLVGISSGTVGFTITQSVTGYYLPNGTYKLTANFNQSPPLFEDFYFQAKWYEPILSSHYLVGGLRVKKTIDYDGLNHTNDVKRRFSYLDDDGLTSGVIFGAPQYTSTFSHRFYSVVNDGAGCGLISVLNRNFFKVTTHSNYPLAGSTYTTQYKKIQIKYGENGENGLEKNEYSIYSDLVEPQFPQFIINREWRRGQLLKKEVLGSNNIKQKEIINTYSEFDEFNPLISKPAVALKTGFNKSLNVAADPGCPIPIWIEQERYNFLVPVYNEYEVISGLTYLSNEHNITYNGGNAITQQSSFEVNPLNIENSNSNFEKSDNGKIIKRTKYLIDFTEINLPVWMQAMKQKGIIAAPIEQFDILEKNGNEYITGATLFEYDANGKIIKTFRFQTNELLYLSSFQPSFINSSGTLEKDSRYILKVSFTYTNYCITEQLAADGITTSFIWGYKQQYPVAKIIGKSYQDAINQSNINLTLLDNPTDDATMRTELNKLRNLTDCFVQTYTYKPLVGITSETDPNGKTIFYEYDSFNRLKLIRDKDNKILKTFDYKYQQPQ